MVGAIKRMRSGIGFPARYNPTMSRTLVCTLVVSVVLSVLLMSTANVSAQATKADAVEKKEVEEFTRHFIDKYRETNQSAPLFAEFFDPGASDCLTALATSDEDAKKLELTSQDVPRIFGSALDYWFLKSLAINSKSKERNPDNPFRNIFPRDLADRLGTAHPVLDDG